MHINKLDYIVKKYNNTHHTTTKMKTDDVKSRKYIDFDKKNNKEDPKFKVGVIFAKGYIANSEMFMIKKVKNTVWWIYVISDAEGKEIVGTFYKKEL